MAIALAHSTFKFGDTTPTLVSGTYTPTAAGNLLIIALVHSAGSSVGDATGITGTPLSAVHQHVARGFFTGASPLSKVEIWSAIATASAGTITIGLPGSPAATGMQCVVAEFSGANTAVGTNGIVQSVSNFSDSNGTAMTATLAAFGNVNNAAFAFGAQTTNAGNPTAKGTWTEVTDNSYASPSNAWMAEYILSNDTAVSMTGAASQVWGVVACEIAAAASSQPITPSGPTVTVTAGTPTISLAGTADPATVTVTPGDLTLSITGGISPTGPTVTVSPGTPFFSPVTPISLTGPTVTVTPGVPVPQYSQATTGVNFWDQVTITVEAAFSAAQGDYGVWDIGAWDTATWGPDLVWSDISQYVRSIQTSIGRSREFDHFSAGTATLVLANRDGRFSPENTSGPYASGGLSGVRPWRPMRIRVDLLNVVFADPAPLYIFYGYAESFTDDFPGTKDSRTTIKLVDGIALIAAFDGFEQPAEGDGEPAGVRIHRVLDNAMWTGGRSIDTSGTLCQATTLAQNAWTELLLTADSDGGDVWVEPDNTLVFEHAGHPYEDPRESSVQATFTDDDTGLRYQDIEFAYDGDLLVNLAKIARAGGTEQTAADNTSRALFGDHLFSRDDLICTTDSQVLSIANRMVGLRAESEKRVKSITIHPRSDPDNLWLQLERRIRDRINIKRTIPGTTVTLDRDCFIDGIEHTITPEDWVTTFTLASATGFATAGEIGVWDSGIWDVAVAGW